MLETIIQACVLINLYITCTNIVQDCCNLKYAISPQRKVVYLVKPDCYNLKYATSPQRKVVYWVYGIHIFSSLKISNKNKCRNILEI